MTTGTLADLANETSQLANAVGATFAARTPTTSDTVGLKTPGGILAFKARDTGGGNWKFGSPQNFDVVTTESVGGGVDLGDFVFNADTHYLTTRGYLAWKENNPVNIGTYRVNGDQTALTPTLKYDSLRIDWAIGSRSGHFYPDSDHAHGRVAQANWIATENQDDTHSGGLYSIATCPGAGDMGLYHNFWVHGLTGAAVFGGRHAQDSMSSIVDYAGYGNVTVYMKAVGTQAAMSYRDVSSTGRGIDRGWNTSVNRLYTYSVTSNNLATMYSYDPANGNQYHGTNENLFVIDNANSRVYVGASSNITSSASKLQAVQASSSALALQRLTDDGAVAQFWAKNGAAVGSISVTNTATAYNTSSDYRLKEGVQPLTGAIARLAKLKPSRFRFIGDATGEVFDGFIAHEVAEVCPQAVTGEKDGEDMQAIDAAKLVPLLVAAVQELAAENQSQAVRLAAIGA